MAVTLLPLCCRANQPPVNYQPFSGAPPSESPLTRDSPGHLAVPMPMPPLVGPGPFEQLPAIDESHPVVVAVKAQTYASFGQLDPVLTEACRLGDFVSDARNRLIVRFTGGNGHALVQMVPPLYRHLLLDRRKLARAGIAYYFFDSDRPDCEVKVDSGTAIRAFPTGRTTALPPSDAKALARRQALIRSWPKS